MLRKVLDRRGGGAFVKVFFPRIVVESTASLSGLVRNQRMVTRMCDSLILVPFSARKA